MDAEVFQCMSCQFHCSALPVGGAVAQWGGSVAPPQVWHKIEKFLAGKNQRFFIV